MANQCTAQINATSLKQALVGCAAADFRGWVTNVALLQVYNGTTGTVVTVTNTSGFVLVVGQQVCVTTGDITSTVPVAPGGNYFTIQFFADNVAITNPIMFSTNFITGAAQFFIDSQIINPATTTITVNSFLFGGLDVTITIGTDVPITEAKLTITPSPEPGPDEFTATFTCDITRRKRRAIASLPAQICVRSNLQSECSDTIVPYRNGLYQFSHKDVNGNCCYIIKRG